MPGTLLKSAKISFLLGVALLIVRNNSYPWPVKRASDILFLLAFIAATGFIFSKKDFSFFKNSLTKKIFWGLSLIFLGLGIATASGFITDGTTINTSGILNAARLAEVAVILLLVGFFQHHDGSFYKKAAIAQLSTLAYLSIFVMPNLLYNYAYRFELWENWPSNVGYYLIVSLSLLFIWILKTGWSYRLLPALAFDGGLAGIMLWTQSRAAWLGIFASAVLTTILWPASWKKKIFYPLIFAAVFALGIIILPTHARNNTLAEFFPELHQKINIASAPAQETTMVILSEKPSLQIASDARRIELWQSYSKKILGAPLGLGPNYDPSPIVGATQGPHNTPLEVLVLAGPLGLLGYIIIFGYAFKNSYAQARPTEHARSGEAKTAPDAELYWHIYLFAALLGLAVAAFFDNMSTFRLMWIVLGMAVFSRNAHPAELIAKPLL